MRISVLRARALAFGAVTALTACTSTSLVNMWRDPSYPRAPLNNVMVVALRKQGTARRLWEDGFVSALQSHGVHATPSYTLFPDAAPDTTALTASIRRSGYDAVLVAHQLPTTTETRYVPGYVSTEPGIYVSPWTGHYYTYYSEVYSPGYVDADRVVRYETEVWMTAGGGRVVWSGTTESINPESAAQVNGEIAGVIVPALIKSGVTKSHK
jgi:hypothetical protein